MPWKNKSYKILMVEDNPGDQLLFKENLLSTNLIISEITFANSLIEGIECLKKDSFSIIFLDLFLPDSNGLSSFSELIKVNSKIPVVIYSGITDTELAINAISLGAQDFLIKGEYPISLLEKTILYAVERKSNLEALAFSNARYDFVSKATQDMVWEHDLINGVIYRNEEGWKRIFGFDKGITGSRENWESRIHPDDIEAIKLEMDTIIHSANTVFFKMSYRIIRDNGSIAILEENGYINRNQQGNAISLIGATRDVTDKKLADAEIEKLSLVARNTLSSVFILGVDRKIQWVNNAFTTITGFTSEEAIGKNPQDLLYGKNPEAGIFTELRDRLDNGLAYESERLNYTKSGKPIWIWLQIQPLYNVNGEVKQYFAVQTDITDKKLAQDELRKLSMVAKETINGVVIRDEKQNIIWVNNAFSKLYGYELEEVIGKNPIEFLHGPDTNLEVVKYAKVQMITKEPFSYEILNYTKAGKKLLVHIQVQTITNDEGKFEQSFSLLTDITRERELEEIVNLEKISKQKQITEAVFAAQERERTEIGRELHDNVTQLLGATRLYIDMARRDDKNRDSLLTSSSKYTLTAIEEIRKLSKTLITPLIKEIGLMDSIKDLVQEIQLVHPVKIHLAAKNIGDDALNDKFKLNIFRIIQEQINNILKHAEAKQIVINIIKTLSQLVLTITDDGIGFNTSVRKPGVGITNIKSRSELYNGIVSLTSEPGEGTSLSITFKNSELMLAEPKLMLAQL